MSIHCVRFSTTTSWMLCRSKINNNTLQKFTVRLKPVAEAKSRIHSKLNEPNIQSHRVVIYNTLCMTIRFLIDAQHLTFSLGPEVLEAIRQVQILGDFGSKIQTLVKHLLYLQVNDPGSKSIVFSAWADSLHSTSFVLLSLILTPNFIVVHVALSLNGIGSLLIWKIHGSATCQASDLCA